MTDDRLGTRLEALYASARAARTTAVEARLVTRRRLETVGWNARRLRHAVDRCLETRAETRAETQLRGPFEWTSATETIEDVVVFALLPDDAS